jgi:cytochrome c-type biogenesis protein CcmH
MIGRLALLAGTFILLAGAAPAVAAPARASLGDIEDEVMCVSCNVSLNVAESPQADATRREIERLIARGDTKQQIKDQLVNEYGSRVLALPSTKGFNLAVYLVPILVGLGLLGLVIYLVPHWRRRGREEDARDPSTTGPEINDADARRLATELDRYDA